MKHLTKILHSLDLFQNGRLSITNLMMFVIIGKLAVAHTIDWQVLVGLFLALASYLHKRQLFTKQSTEMAKAQAAAVEKNEADRAELAAIKNQVQMLVNQSSASAALNPFR